MTEDKPPLAVLMVNQTLSRDDQDALAVQWDTVCQTSGFNGVVVTNSELQVHHDIAPVLDAIAAQYETISRLVEQNAQLIEMLAPDETAPGGTLDIPTVI